MSRTRGAIPPLPNTPPCCSAHLKVQEQVLLLLWVVILGMMIKLAEYVKDKPGNGKAK
jgi:hypothetical protein